MCSLLKSLVVDFRCALGRKIPLSNIALTVLHVIALCFQPITSLSVEDEGRKDGLPKCPVVSVMGTYSFSQQLATRKK